MSLNKDQWKIWNVRKPCPFCYAGLLIPAATKGSFNHETPDSKFMREYGHHYANYFFSLTLVCSNCSEKVIVSGDYEEPTSPIDEEGNMPRSVHPKIFIPTLHLIPIPKKCPKAVRTALINSFALYWMDAPSAAGKIRVALEFLMDSLKINKTQLTAKGKRVRLKLHDRLVIYAGQQPVIGAFLTSIKWIGNVGSHSNLITQDDLLDAYSLLEHCLDALFSDNHKNLTSLSKKINIRKGPLKKR